jgi:Fe-S oxidoreductase/nitrate reductase gamma subunit
MTTESATSSTASTNSKKKFSTFLADYFVNILGQVRILKKAYPGIMHFLIFWGMTLLTLGHIILLMQMALFLPFALSIPRSNLYLVFETISDFAGLALLLGLGMATVRRLFLRPNYLESRWDDYYALIILALIPLMGYINEATRITATNPDWASRSPIGNLVAGWLQNAGLTAEQAASLHDPLVIVHIGIGLLFLISIPYTKLRHLFVTPINILFRERKENGEISTIEDIDTAELLGAGNIEEFSTTQLMSFDACLRCGRCEDACPATASGMSYSPRKLIQSLRDTMQSSLVTPMAENGKPALDVFDEEYPWSCTTCGACIVKCPAFVNPVDQIMELRRYQVLTTGKMPKTVGETLRNMERQGNPWGLPPQERGKWVGDLDLPYPDPDKKVDVLMFFGCAMAFDERNKKIARTITNLLTDLGVDFAALGMDEGCCGETARRMGHEYVFQVMAEQNIEIFNEFQFDRIVTPCPHCYNTLKNEYPAFGADFEVIHLSQLLNEKLGDTQSAQKNGSKATYHDPCYLGRYNNQFDAPRALINKTSVNVTEMQDAKMESFCCGGGGGQMWLETDADTRINHKRLDQAVETGADTVITACPYCLTMFEDAIGAKGLNEQIQVIDIAEAIANDRM